MNCAPTFDDGMQNTLFKSDDKWYNMIRLVIESFLLRRNNHAISRNRYYTRRYNHFLDMDAGRLYHEYKDQRGL